MDVESNGNGRNYDHLKPTQFKPGQSGNPAGRKKGTARLSDAYRRILAMKIQDIGKPKEAFQQVINQMVEEGATFADFVALAQVRQAIKGRTAAASEIADRAEGKAKQKIEVSRGGGPLEGLDYDLDNLSVDDLKQLRDLLKRAGPKHELTTESDSASD